MTATHLHEHTRGALKPEDLRFLPPAIDEQVLRPFLLQHWGIEGEFRSQEGERDQNIRVTCADGSRYLLKVASPGEDLELVDFQIQALLHLEAADASIPIPRVIRSLTGNCFETLTTEDGDHPIRLLSWVDGVPIGEFDHPSPEAIAQIGTLQGRMCRAFQGFEHAGGAHFMPWDILNGLVISESLCNDYLRGELAARCAPALEHLAADALPRMRALPHQVIHNDAHSGNVLCDPDDPSSITGVIDFGDLLYRPIVVDLAASMSSIIDSSDAPIRDCAVLLGSFAQHAVVSPEQLELVYDAVLARAILIVQLLQYRAEHTAIETGPDEEVLREVQRGLEKVLDVDRVDFLNALKNEL